MLEMKDSGLLSSQLPPGFRFHPTDQELITHYLRRKVAGSLPPEHAIIAGIDLYKYNPWDLPEMSFFGEEEWFFFSPRERKYPNGVRPNRAAASGYWKATGTDKPILAAGGARCIGVKKALVFYLGRPPKGTKTDWVMQEYRLLDSMAPSRVQTQKDSMRLDDWVLCRVRHRGDAAVTNDEVPLIRSPPVSVSTNSTQTEEKPLVTETKMRSFNTEYSGQQLQSYFAYCPTENVESNNGEDVSSPPLHPAGSCSVYTIAQQQLQTVASAVRSMKRKHTLAEMDDMTQQQACKRLQFSADGRLLPVEPSFAEQSSLLDFMYQSSWSQGQRCD